MRVGEQRDDLPALLRDFDRRLSRQESHVHHGGASAIAALRAEVDELRGEVEMLKRERASSKTEPDRGG